MIKIQRKSAPRQKFGYNMIKHFQKLTQLSSQFSCRIRICLRSQIKHSRVFQLSLHIQKPRNVFEATFTLYESYFGNFTVPDSFPQRHENHTGQALGLYQERYFPSDFGLFSTSESGVYCIRHSQICNCQNSRNDKFGPDNVRDRTLISRLAREF